MGGVVDPGIAVVEEVQPLTGAQSHGGIDAVGITLLDDMYVLQPKTLAGAQHGAGVVGLEDVLQHRRQAAGPLRQHRFDAVPSFGGQETAQVCGHLRFEPGVHS